MGAHHGTGGRQIYAGLRDPIPGGVFGPGGGLPPSRAPAAGPGWFAAEGYIAVWQGARTRVAARIASPPAAAGRARSW